MSGTQYTAGATREPVRDWLARIGLARYAAVLERNGLDWQALAQVTEDRLKALGLRLGDRKRLLAALSREIDMPSEAARSTPPESTAYAHAERRQLTALFCELDGYTELASRLDPEVLQDVVSTFEDACAAAITRYDGYVFQRLGDGIVAFFGYPLAHEGEAERAIRAGLRILETLSHLEAAEGSRLSVRVGIATGMVVVSSPEKGAVGETMNLAARLRDIAQPASLIVSERVRRLAAGVFDYEDLGEQTLKGIARPTHAYRVLGLSEAASRFDAATGQRLTPLVGREQELGLLLARWTLAQSGEGQVVVLSGEPGIGKSRLLRALRERLAAQGAKALRLQCSPYYVNSAFWPSIDNLERTLDFGRDDTPDVKLDKVEALVLDTLGHPSADARFVATMLSIPCEHRYGPVPMTRQKFKDETIRTLVDLTAAAARRQPTLVLFEDLHWADPTTLEVLDLLVDRVKAVPLLVVFTHRPEFHPRWLPHGHVTSLNLAKLTRAQSRALVLRLTGGKSLPADLLDEILAKTDGVPLFVEELTKSILESDQLRAIGERYEYAGSSRGVAIPVTLRDSLMARLDRYAPVKEVAQIGAAIGREFSYELIAAVAPMPPLELDAALERLTDAGLAFRKGTPPQAVYTFKHALVQDAAYDTLLRSRRQELHAKIARVIEATRPSIEETEPELLAHHLTNAGLSEAAIPLWRQAGALALRRMALKESIRHLEKGLELAGRLPPSPARDASELSLRSLLGTAWIALDGWPAEPVWTSLQPALPLARSLRRTDALLPTLFGLWANVLCRGRIAQSLEWVDAMFDAARTTGSADLLIIGHAAALGSHFWLGNLAQAREHADRVLALYSEAEHYRLVDIVNRDPKTMVGAYATHWTWMFGYPDEAVRLSDAKDADARTRGHPFNLGWVLTFGADLFDYRGEPQAHRQRAEEAERVGRDNSLPFLTACMAPIRVGMAMIRSGEIATGLTRLREGLAVWEDSGGKLYSPYLWAVYAEGLARQNRVEEALGILAEQIDQIERPGWEERLHYAEILRLRGWMRELKGDDSGAEASFLAALDWARRQQAVSWELRTATSLARLWLRRGERERARALLAPVYAWFREGFDTKDLKEAQAVLATLEC